MPGQAFPPSLSELDLQMLMLGSTSGVFLGGLSEWQTGVCMLPCAYRRHFRRADAAINKKMALRRAMLQRTTGWKVWRRSVSLAGWVLFP